MTRKGLITTSVTIEPDDFDYIKTKGFKATSLLRAKIKEMKDKEYSMDNEIKRTLEGVNKIKNRLLSFVRSKDLMVEFMNYKEPIEELMEEKE